MKTFLSLIFVVLLISLVYSHVELAGITQAKYNGMMINFFYDQNGYDDAKEACEAEFANSHVCVDSEVGIIAQTDSLFIVPFGNGVRFIDMALGYEPNTGLPVNDCRGWTSNQTDYYSTCLIHRVGGPILPSFCDCQRPLSFICCYDLNDDE